MQSQKVVIPTPIVKQKVTPAKPTFVYDEGLASSDGSLVSKIVLDAEKNGYNFIPKVSLLNSLAKINNPLVENSFQLDNQGEKWGAYSDENFPVTFNELILIRLKFDSKVGPSGITFGGYAFKEKEAINIFFQRILYFIYSPNTCWSNFYHFLYLKNSICLNLFITPS